MNCATRRQRPYSLNETNFFDFLSCMECNSSTLPYVKLSNGVMWNNSFLGSFSCSNVDCVENGIKKTCHACCLNKKLCPKIFSSMIADRSGEEGNILYVDRRRVYNDLLKCEVCHQRINNLFFANVIEYEKYMARAVKVEDVVSIEDEAPAVSIEDEVPDDKLLAPIPFNSTSNAIEEEDIYYLYQPMYSQFYGKTIIDQNELSDPIEEAYLHWRFPSVYPPSSIVWT